MPEGYPDLVLAGGALRERGVDFHDLTGLFDDVSEAFDFTIKDASANAHSVAIKVTDKAGVMTTARVWVAE